MPTHVSRPLSRFLGRLRAIEQTSTFGVQITQMIGLKSVSEDTKQQMLGQVRGRSPPQYGVPAAPDLPDVEITQAPNLDVQCLPVRYCRADPDARHELRATGACRRDVLDNLDRSISQIRASLDKACH
jgi:hypothetical protein